MAAKKNIHKIIEIVHKGTRGVLESIRAGFSSLSRVFQKNERKNTRFTSLSNRVGIDLGTATTVVYVEKRSSIT